MTVNFPIVIQIIISILTGVLISLFAVVVMYFISSIGFLFINLIKNEQLKPIIRGNLVVKLVILIFFICRLLIRSLSPFILNYGEPLSLAIFGAYVIEPISFFFMSTLYKEMRNLRLGVENKSRKEYFKKGSDIMTCKKCKNEIDADSLFCQFCGNKILVENIEKLKK